MREGELKERTLRQDLSNQQSLYSLLEQSRDRMEELHRKEIADRDKGVEGIKLRVGVGRCAFICVYIYVHV